MDNLGNLGKIEGKYLATLNLKYLYVRNYCFNDINIHLNIKVFKRNNMFQNIE